MDILTDIEKFKSLGYKALSEEFKKEEENLRVRKYLFKVINTINELNFLIENDVFLSQGMQYLRLHNGYNVALGQIFSYIEILDEDKKPMLYGNFKKEYKLVCDLFDQHNFQLELGLVNTDSQSKKIEIALNEKAQNSLKNYLLNEDLIKAYDYFIMLEKKPPQNKQAQYKNKI